MAETNEFDSKADYNIDVQTCVKSTSYKQLQPFVMRW